MIKLYMCVCMPSHFSCGDFATPWTTARQAPLSTGFSRQDNWNGLPCPPPGDIPDPGIKPTSLKSPALAGMSLPLLPPGKPYIYIFFLLFFSIIVYYRILCCTVGPHCLSVLYITVCISWSQIPNLFLPQTLSPLVAISLFSMPVSLLLFCK